MAAGLFVEKLGQAGHHGAAQFFGVDDGHRFAVVAGHVVADADRRQLYTGFIFDKVDDVA